jgi:hypothetical protein
MKRIISLAVICLSLVQLIAQNLPQGIAYQAVAVKDGPYSLAGQNPQAIYWSNKDIKVRFTIYEKYPGGSTQYSEFHATKTDDYGVFNLIIGQGNPISGNFIKIPWDLGTAHLQLEIDFDNNGTYKLTSLERFWSVPYAFVTRKSSSTSTDSALNALNSKFNYLKNRDKDTVIGNEGGVSYKSLDSLNKVLIAKLAALKASDKDTVIGNEWQKVTRNKDTLILSDGGGKVTLLDEDPKNELQKISLTNDTLMLSNNGGSVALSSVVSKYGYKPSLSNTINTVSTNSLCFNGVLVNLESWGVTNGYTFITPHGEIADSICIFTAGNTSNRAVFLHNIKLKKITQITTSPAYRVFVGDSIVYLIMDNAPTFTTAVKKLNSKGSLDSISEFSNGPGYYNFGQPRISKSGELVWIYSSSGTQEDIKKFSLSSKTVVTYSNPQKGKSYGTTIKLGGDTMILGTRMMNTKTMTQINDFSFLQKSSQRGTAYLNGKIYYLGTWTASSTGTVLRVYDLKSQYDVPIGGVASFQFLGKNNNELWFTTGVDAGNTASHSRLGNLGISNKMPTIGSILFNGMFVDHGFGDESTMQTLNTDNDNKISGAFYSNGIAQYYHCVNGTMPLYSLGYFYSK